MLGLHVRVIWTEKNPFCAIKAVVSHAEKPHLSQRLETAALTLASVSGLQTTCKRPLIIFVGQECLHSESISSELSNGIKGSFQMCSW